MDDLLIIELYNNRDERAISETSSKYGKYCFAIANNILKNNEDSEECVNDTWIRTWNSIPPSKPSSLKSFLAKITRNLSFDRYKQKNRIKRGGNELSTVFDEVSGFVFGESMAENELLKKELVEAINKFLRTISIRDCNIFIRRYFYVDTSKNIAERYSMKENSVLKILSRTRQKLQKYLRTEGYVI